MSHFALFTACVMLPHCLMPEQQDQNNGTTVVQQDGALLSFNKMAHHCLSTRLRTMTVKQDGTPLPFNKMAYHCRSTRWRTVTFPHRSDAIFTQLYPKRGLDVRDLLSGPPHSPDILTPTIRPQFAAAHHGGRKGGPRCAAANTVELECR